MLNMRMSPAAENPGLPKVRLGGEQEGGGTLRRTAPLQRGPEFMPPELSPRLRRARSASGPSPVKSLAPGEPFAALGYNGM